MFRLHKTRPTKSGENIDFKFSNFKANQVPKGWDRLFMSIISLENGKTIAKTSKAVVRNGTCQWTETVSESIWVPEKKGSRQEMDDCLFKLVVAMGSARSGVLGEATVNMRDYINSNVSVPVSLPLKKCSHGTILHVKIHCMTPRPKPMDDESKQTNSDADGELSLKSDGPESISMTEKNVGASPTQDLDSVPAPRQPELESRQEESFSTSDSLHSYDSAESSIGREGFSPVSNLPNGNSHLDDLSQSDHSSFDSQMLGPQTTFSASSTLTVTTDSSKDLLEAAEKTIEELRAESKMWETNARKLMLGLDTLRKQYSEQSKKQANLDTELSAANSERDGLRKEVEQLKLVLEDSTVEKELENEIKLQKESNANLGLQLKRSQDANAELVSVLQELERTIEMQKVEMESISAMQAQFSELENSIQTNTEENNKLLRQLQQSKESEKALKEKEDEMEEVYKSKLADKEREIVGLKVKLSESVKERRFVNEESRKRGDDAVLIREIKALKAKLEELECDCNELTDENLELLLKMKETKNNLNGVDQATELSENNKSQLHFLEEKLKKKILREIQSDYNSYIQELETQIMELEEVDQKRTEMQKLEAMVVHGSCMDSDISADKIPEGKSSELKDENKQLSTRLSLIEAELEALKDERDSTQMQLESQKTYMEKQMQDMHDQWLASKESCEFLSRANTKLQEECNSFQKSAEDLRKEKSALDEHCAYLEAKLRESDKSLTDCSKKIEALDENLSLVIEDSALKEESLTLELNTIHDKSKKLEAKLKLEESSWNQMHLHKANEAENLRQEVEQLAKQLSEAHHEKEKSSENHETLMAEHEKALKFLESYKSSEGKLKTIVNGLELKLTVSEYERQQVSEQSTNMKVQLLKLENLQDDILALRDECNAIKAEKQKLEASLGLLSGECDDLKAENNSFVVQISTLQKVVSELEGHKHEKVALEEKLVKMEGELMVKEALLMQDGEIKNEVYQIKKANRQFQQQIKQLQEEKDELMIKAQTLEKKLKPRVEEKQQKTQQSNSHSNQHKREDNNNDSQDGSPRAVGVDPVSKIQLLENELAKAMEANNKYKILLNRLSNGRKSQSNTPRKSSMEGGEVVSKEKYDVTKSSLEAELKDIRERYLHMSLKYAEVEAQREELVMKIRGVKSMRRWFSNPSN